MSALNEDIFINNLQVFYDMLNNDLGNLGFYQVMLLPDGKKKLIFFSKTCAGQLGYSRETVMDDPDIISNCIIEEHREKYFSGQEKCFDEISNFDMEIKCLVSDGTYKWFHLFATTKALVDGSIVFNAIQTDITESKINEEKLIKYNRELSLRNKVNEKIASQTNAIDIFNAVCQSLVEEGGYLLSAISLKPIPENPNQNIYPIASAGSVNYLKEIAIDLSDEQLNSGPTAIAIKTTRTVINNNFFNNPAAIPWAATAKKFNIASSIVIPLFLANDQIGVLSVYSDRFDAFDQHEVEVLEMIAKSIVIAANNIQHKNEKEYADFLLRGRMKELQTLYNTTQIIQNEEIAFVEKIENLMKILPSAWQYEDDAVVKVFINGTVYISENYCSVPDSKKVSIYSLGKEVGYIEIGYLSQHKTEDYGPFLKEEIRLLEALAKLIGEYCDKSEARMAFHQSQANLSTIFKYTDVGYILLDNQFNIISFNDSIQNGYAHQLGVVLKNGDNLLELLPDERSSFKKMIFYKAIAKKQSIEYEVSHVRYGETKYYINNIHPVIDDNLVLGISFSSYEITKRKEEELAQQKITRDLLQRNRDLEQFSYIVSHNIRGPLSNIMGLTAGLKMAVSKEEEAFFLEGISQSAENLDNVIKDINYILQINRTVFEEKEATDFDQIYKEAISGIEDLIAEKNAIIQTDFSQVNNIFLVKAYLINVFFNLIMNALKFSKPEIPPNIYIWSELTNEKIVVHFRDNGLGIDLDRYGQFMFGLYKRFHPQFQGKGMGLYIVKSQVQLLGGEITVSSVPNAGTEFIIYLPVN